MKIVKSLGKYPEMPFYMWIHKITKFKCPKVIWFEILKKMIEMMNLKCIISIFDEIKPKVGLLIQLNECITSTIYYFTEYKKYIGCNLFFCEINLEKEPYKLELIHDENLSVETYSHVGHCNHVYKMEDNYFGCGFGRVLKRTYIYEGNFNFGHEDGYGTQYNIDGTIYYRGFFKEGLKNGNGSLYENNNLIYVGNFYNDDIHGFGTIYWENGNKVYQGLMENSVRHGHGTSYYKNGQISYIGEYKNNKRFGKGKLYSKNGIFEGIFKDKPVIGTFYWNKSCENYQYFGRPLKSKINNDSYKTIWSESIVTKGSINDDKNIGYIKRIFDDYIIFLSKTDDMNTDEYILFSFKHKLKKKKSILF